MSTKQPLGREWRGPGPSYHEYDGPPVRFERPFAKTNWKNATARDEWTDPLAEARAAKDAAEWRSVLSGETNRRAAIIHVNNLNRDEWLERVAKHGLYYKPLRYTEPYSGYSHKHYPTSKTDPNRITYAAIAREEADLDAFAHAEIGDEQVDHAAVGELLGFPECCREFFNDVWVSGEKLDPMYEISCNSANAERVDGDPDRLLITDPNPGANVLWRYFGWSFITHLPCSWDCEESIEIARQRYKIMCEAGYEDGANALYEWLSQPHEWTGFKAICEMRNQYLIGCSHTTSYWRKKTITWGGPHKPGGSIL